MLGKRLNRVVVGWPFGLFRDDIVIEVYRASRIKQGFQLIARTDVLVLLAQLSFASFASPFEWHLSNFKHLPTLIKFTVWRITGQIGIHIHPTHDPQGIALSRSALINARADLHAAGIGQNVAVMELAATGELTPSRYCQAHLIRQQTREATRRMPFAPVRLSGTH